MLARLLACPSCARHFRVDDERCPFCGAARPESFDTAPAPEPPPRGLSRAALAAVRVAGVVGSGAAIAIALSGCHRSSDAGLNQMTLYGGPPPEASGAGDLDAATPPATPDVARHAAVYGAPPPRHSNDAGRDWPNAFDTGDAGGSK